MEVLGNFDVAVIGAGHAGIEAAVASARRGCKTALFTISLDSIANMPCNPSVGGSAKGHLVREIDALGGVMGKAADACCLQMRMLNLSKGASVHSPRAQVDRRAYHTLVKSVCERTENLYLIQSEITELMFDESGRVTGLRNAFGAEWNCKAAVLCAGTFLRGKVFIGKTSLESGPDSLLPARLLSGSLGENGIALRRFKTGTPCRVHRESIDFSVLRPQKGDENPRPFSFSAKRGSVRNDLLCHIAYTNEETHRVIRESLSQSPLYSGLIEGVGPRYCPSIEDKVVRFPQRERHQIFVEPTGADTEEMYLQGFSTSLPEDVQLRMLRTVRGFEHIAVMRSAYAIEYDCLNPVCLRHTLAFRDFHGLYAAGQINGTSGYEEAAAQGLIAGVNASAYVKDEEELTLTRDSSYIGTLIDDLVTKGTDDPYRMNTARCENRLALRHSTADARLTPIGRKYGLIPDDEWARFRSKMEHIETAREKLRGVNVAPSRAINAYLAGINSAPLSDGCPLEQLLRRPGVEMREVLDVLGIELNLDEIEEEEVALEIKYDLYIAREKAQNERFSSPERVKLPYDLPYESVRGLSSEGREKLLARRPENLLQAGRISGVSPADIAVLAVWLKAGGANGQP